MAPRVSIELPSLISDGDSRVWPEANYHHPPGDSLYHDKLADFWMEEQSGHGLVTRYTFSSLPAGYRVFTRQRIGATVIDRYLFGHPRNRFDSPKKFWPHFKWLMNGKSGSCACVNCSRKSLSDSTAPRKRNFESIMVSEEQTHEPPMEKYLKHLADKKTRVDLAFDPEMKAGWEELHYERTKHEPESHHQDRQAFEPRLGELVLFCQDDSVCIHPESQKYLVFDKKSNTFGSFPKWKAGIIATVPDEASLHHLSHPISSDSLDGKGGFYRIELLPINGDSAALPKATNANLSHIKPMSFFHEVLSGIPYEEWDDSIRNACQFFHSYAPVNIFRFEGCFPHANFWIRGLWLGSEMVEVGDAVRLVPDNNPNPRTAKCEVEEVLVVEQMIMRFMRADKFPRKPSIEIRGRSYSVKPPSTNATPIFTSTSPRAELSTLRLPQSMQGYTWYQVRGNEMTRTSPWDILGRLYEREAMLRIINAQDFGDVGYHGLYFLRAFLRALYLKKINPDLRPGVLTVDAKDILYADRIRMLGIEWFRGEAVGKGRNREKLVLDLPPLSFSAGEAAALEGPQDQTSALLGGSELITGIEEGIKTPDITSRQRSEKTYENGIGSVALERMKGASALVMENPAGKTTGTLILDEGTQRSRTTSTELDIDLEGKPLSSPRSV